MKHNGVTIFSSAQIFTLMFMLFTFFLKFPEVFLTIVTIAFRNISSTSPKISPKIEIEIVA